VSAKITETFVKRVKPPATGYVIYSDGEVDGFGLRVTAAGQKSFVLSYRPWRGHQQRRYTIGKYPDDYSATTARAKAIELRQGIREGKEPFAEQERRALEAAEADARTKTVKQLAAAYLERHVTRNLRTKTQRDYRDIVTNHILPRLGPLRIGAVTRRDVAEMHAGLHATPYLANRVLAVTSAMFGWAKKDSSHEQEWGVETNPSEGVERCHEEQRERWLSAEEMERFATALDEYPEKHTAGLDCSEKQKAHMRAEAQRICNAIRLIMLTGSRKGEALSATWAEFDLKRGIWTKPTHHTKQKRKEHIPLGRDVIALLKSIPGNGSELVFPGRLPDQPFTDIKSAWGEICDAAQIIDLRPHDLRHNYASYLVSNGVSLQVVGKLLGHTQPQTTWRYAHVADKALREATNIFGALVRSPTK
jgi:integrase